MITFIADNFEEKYKKAFKNWIRKKLRTFIEIGQKEVQCRCEETDYAFLEVLMEDEFKDIIVDIYVGDMNSIKKDYLRRTGYSRRALIFDGGNDSEINQVFREADIILCGWSGGKHGNVWDIIKENNEKVLYWDKVYEP